MILSASDRAVIELSGLGKQQELGVRPALIVVDVTYSFCGFPNEELLESVRRWGTSCGPNAWNAIAPLQKLLAVSREASVPVFYTRAYSDLDTGGWSGKDRRAGAPPQDRLPRWNDIVDDVAPSGEDVVIEKGKPSAFFGTPFLSLLVEQQIDTLIVCGTTTSGCVRATVVDAFSLNFRVGVVEDATFDRLSVSHSASLLDMDQRYANVLSLHDAAAYLARPAGSPDDGGGG